MPSRECEGNVPISYYLGKHHLEDILQLIAECADNNRLSQEKLYYKLYPALFLLCRKFFSDNNDALEALNDGMVLVFRHLKKYDPSKGAFFNWAYTVVRNAALDKLKQNKWPDHQELDNYLPEKKSTCSATWNGRISISYWITSLLPPGPYVPYIIWKIYR